MIHKDMDKERVLAKITKVRKYDSGFEVTKSDGWSLWIDKKYDVIPMVNDTIITYGKRFGRIQGIQINDKVLFLKTDEEMEKEHQEWVEATKKKNDEEYRQLMEKIKDEESFETVDISGMGSGYERECQRMLRVGITFLKEHPEFHFDYQGYSNVVGLCWTDTPWGKDLDKAITEVAPGCTGAMHEAVIGHLAYIHKYGYKKWLTKFRKRKYVYPSELPAPAFGRN